MSEKEKLIQMIKEDPNIIRYRKIEELIHKDQELGRKMNQLKAIQKQLVNAKELQKTQAIQTYQNAFDALYEEIESYPLIPEYLALQSDINAMLKEIQSIIEEGIENDFKR